MKRYNFLILCVILGSLSAKAADQEKFCGTVINGDTSAPVAGAIVKAGDAFVFTDKEGYFSISPKVTADSISFRCLGFEPLTLPISSDFSNVSLYHKVTQLKDVIVEAPDIYARGDTLIFNVARYANAQDNAIIDVIKRLPGIKVKEDGTIEYQGKPINKFYLDGNDFIGGQYGLATNNISHKDVKAVEIMENHQPIKALEGIEFPEEAGINLKLKEDAQNRWVGVAKAGVGIQPLLYSGSLFAMRMAPNIQNMFTLKADNTGWNPANEIKDHDFDTMFSQDYSSALWPEFISADIITSPLSDKRTRDNLSFLANTITAWKRGDTSMRIKMDYIGERLDYNSGVTTDYFSSQIPVFIQNDTQRTRRHDVSAHFYSITNRSGYYLKDKLSVSSVRNKSNSDIVGSFNLTQHIDKKIFSAANDLKLVKRNEKRLFILSSRCSFEHHPDRMMISGEEDAFQSISTTDFRCTTETSLGKLTRFWKFYLTAGLDINYHRQENTLSGIEEFENNIVYKAFLSNLYALPQIDFDRNGWRISLNMPLKWLNYSAGATYNYVNVSPQLKVRRRLTAKSELSGVINYSLGSPQPYLNIASPVLTDYRNIFIAVNSNKYSQDCAASISYRCRNPLKSLFLNLSVAYSYHRCSVITNQLFVEDFIISTYKDMISRNDTWSIKGSFSKGLGHSKMVLGFEVDVSLASASSMRDNLVMPYRQTHSGIKPYFKGSIMRWLSLNYEAEYGVSKLTLNNENNMYHTLHQNLFATIIPIDDIQFTFGAEHFLTRFPEGSLSNLILLDASANWRINSKIRLSITASNLLNKRCYMYVNYGTLSRSEHSFTIRPRSIMASIQYQF